MKFYHVAVTDPATNTLRQKPNRPLTQSEVGVYVVDYTNHAIPGDRITLDAFRVFGIVANQAELTSVENGLDLASVGRIWFKSDDETFHRYAGDAGFEDYVPVNDNTPTEPITYAGLKVIVNRGDALPNTGEAVSAVISGVEVPFVKDGSAYVLDGFPQAATDIIVKAHGYIGSLRPVLGKITGFDPSAEVTSQDMNAQGQVVITVTTNADGDGFDYAVYGSNRTGSGTLAQLVIPGLTVTVSFDTDTPYMDNYALYWSGLSDTDTVNVPWDGIGSKELHIGFPPSMTPGSQTLIMAADLTTHDPSGVIFSFLSFDVTDTNAEYVGSAEYTPEHTIVGTSGALVGATGGLSSWNDYADTNEPIQVTYFGDNDAEDAIKGFPGNLRVLATYEGNDYTQDWTDRNNGITLTIPGVARSSSLPITLTLQHEVGGDWLTASGFEVVTGTLTPFYRPATGNYRGGFLRYVASGGTFDGLKSDDLS